MTVSEMIAARAADIEVRIGTESEALTVAWPAMRPLLVVAVHELDHPWSGGGKLIAGIDYDKVVQHDRLARASLPTPRTKRLSESSSLRPSDWGEYVIVKPALAHLGEGVRLLRTADLPGFVARLGDDQRRQIIVQPYVEHADLGGRPFEFRVLAFFGKLIYATRNRWPVSRAPLAQIAVSSRGVIASNASPTVTRVRALTDDAEVIRLGLAAARAFPELPSVAVDIIRSRVSGAYFILEVNPKGESWHLSSDFALQTFDPEHRAALYTQHDALSIVAISLIEKTRAEAL